MMENPGGRAGVAVRAAAIASLVVILAGAVATRDLWSGTGSRERTSVETVVVELGAVRSALVIARDSTDRQIAGARHLLGWLEQTEDASSADLVRILSGLLRAHHGPAALGSVAELVATGDLAVVPDAAVRARLIALDRRLAAASASGEPLFERYRVRLEESLSPGMWRYVYYGESGKLPLDYRGTLRELHDSGFDRTVRSALRGLLDVRAELDLLAVETSSLIEVLPPAQPRRADS